MTNEQVATICTHTHPHYNVMFNCQTRLLLVFWSKKHEIHISSSCFTLMYEIQGSSLHRLFNFHHGSKLVGVHHFSVNIDDFKVLVFF